MSETDMDWPLRQVDMSLQMDGTYSYGLGRLGRPGMSKPWVRLRPEVAEAINEQVAEGLAAEHRLAYAEGRAAEHERSTERLDEGWRALLADLRADVQAMHDEAGQALLHADTHDEVTAASVGISVLDDVLSLLNGGDDA